MNNYTVYAKDELQNWIDRAGLIKAEAYLIDKYIEDKKSNLLEAGTGGGRISIEIAKRYKKLNITAFDFVEDMIKSAKKKAQNINFIVADASNLSKFNDESFEYAIYLQQIVSLVPKDMIYIVIKEAYRVIKKDGIVLFSFLYFNGRRYNRIFSFFINCMRLLRKEKIEPQSLPWLKLSGKPNVKIFFKDQATTYWFKRDEIIKILTDIGFEIVETTTTKEIENRHSGSEGMLYIVCKKL